MYAQKNSGFQNIGSTLAGAEFAHFTRNLFQVGPAPLYRGTPFRGDHHDRSMRRQPTDGHAPRDAQRRVQHMLSFSFTGSHDSFTSSMKTTNDFGPDCPAAIRDACKLTNLGKCFVERWSVTQRLGLTQQLEAGIRYFDFRVAVTKKCPEELYFSHGLLCDKVEPSLREISEFLDAHPKEVVLLDFNHFYNMADPSYKLLIDFTVRLFGEKLCPKIDDPVERKALSLESLWRRGHQVIAFCECKYAKTRPEVWSSEYIRSAWANTCNVDR